MVKRKQFFALSNVLAPVSLRAYQKSQSALIGLGEKNMVHLFVKVALSKQVLVCSQVVKTLLFFFKCPPFKNIFQKWIASSC